MVELSPLPQRRTRSRRDRIRAHMEPTRSITYPTHRDKATMNGPPNLRVHPGYRGCPIHARSLRMGGVRLSTSHAPPNPTKPAPPLPIYISKTWHSYPPPLATIELAPNNRKPQARPSALEAPLTPVLAGRYHLSSLFDHIYP